MMTISEAIAGVMTMSGTKAVTSTTDSTGRIVGRRLDR
jgi:hypothetical protein